MRRRFLSLGICWLSFLTVMTVSADEVSRVDFVKEVQPIFRRRCYSCHGRDKQEGGLRLDRKKRALQGGDTVKAIVPGRPQESHILALVAETVAGERMPPEGALLTAAEIQSLRRWIEQGAHWPEDTEVEEPLHWAFQPVRAPVIPNQPDSVWSRNGLDAFIYRMLASHQRVPSADAQRAVLIRRVYLDVLGLPPTPQEWESWRRDPRVDWYERMVDRVLASPHFGERWGRLWLDLARYADSDGYEKDQPRPHAFHWRDWVFEAFNRDLPFDQFTVQQIAGDLLPGATAETKLATGFHRNTLTNREGGIDKEEDRVKQTVDRINTVASVWLGLTVKCAQCHSHKYDPITQREYYQLYAFFNNADESDFALDATEIQRLNFQRQRDAHEKERQQLSQQWTAARRKIMNSLPEILAEYRQKYGDRGLQPPTDDLLLHATFDGKLTSGVAAREAKWKGTPAPQFATGQLGKAVRFQGQQAVELATPFGFQSDQPFTIAAWVYNEGGIGAIVTKLNEDANFKGVDFTSNEGMLEVHLVEHWPRDAIKVTTKARLKKNQWQHVMVAYDGSRKAAGVRIYIDGAPQSLDTHFDQLTGSIDINEPLRIGSRKRSSYFRGRVDEVFVYRRVLDEAGRRALSGDPGLQEFLQLAAIPADQRTAAQAESLVDFLVSRRGEAAELGRRLDVLEKAVPKLERGTGMGLSPAAKPRRTFVHVRGNFLDPGAEVTAEFLEFLPPAVVRGSAPDRLDLARWITSENNPLTARVLANRLWQHYFQTGLVRTSDDFGSQGEPPTHPELLDWLASEFKRQDWQMKSVHRRILLSSTYRQSSQVRSDLLEWDPDNRFLARQNRARVEAELVRDLGLAVSGLLDQRVGGRSVYPPLPPGILELAFVDVINRGPWKASTGGDRYRRGVYTFFQRTSPYPMLSLFDAPDSNTSCTRRERSNTPLQALTLWNDPLQMEAARHFACRILREEEATDAERMQRAFVIALSREPSAEDLNDLNQLLDSARNVYRQQPALAAQLIADIELGRDITTTEFAAWIALTRTIMNLDEFITRE